MHKEQIEGAFIPQGIGAYYLNHFSFTAKGSRLEFEKRISYRVIERKNIFDDLWLYSVEAQAVGLEPKSVKTFTVYFNRSALGSASGESIQPAPYALERSARMSGLSEGYVGLVSLDYDEKTGQFKAVVRVAASIR
ncbi:MAG: hypothetical protein SNJ56_04930 [Termitinemataceae bacterium]